MKVLYQKCKSDIFHFLRSKVNSQQRKKKKRSIRIWFSLYNTHLPRQRREAKQLLFFGSEYQHSVTSTYPCCFFIFYFFYL